MGGKVCWVEVIAAPVIQTFSQCQSEQDVCGSCLRVELDWIDFWLIRCKNILSQQVSICLSGGESPPADYIQGPNWVGFELDRRLLAFFVALQEQWEQKPPGNQTAAAETVKGREREREIMHNQQHRILQGNKSHSNKWEGRTSVRKKPYIGTMLHYAI